MKKIVVSSLLVILCSSLHLNTLKGQNDLPLNHNKKHKRYYSKHYMAHRQQQYRDRIAEQNRKKIQNFNKKNQKKMKAAPGDSFTVTGGVSFTMDQNQFIEFQGKEFIALFTGRMAPQSSHHKHLQTNQHQTTPDKKQSPQSADEKILNSYLTSRVDSTLRQDTQSEERTIDLFSEEQFKHGEAHLRSQYTHYYYNPYNIDENYLNDIYGNVNSQDNYGWNYQKLDPNYYKSRNQFGSNQEFWNNWQSQHGGRNTNYQNNYPNNGYNNYNNRQFNNPFADFFQNPFGQFFDDPFADLFNDPFFQQPPWWQNWLQIEQQNQQNDEWWEFDDWQQPNPYNPTPAPEPQPQPEPQPTPEPNSQNSMAPFSQDAIQVNWVKRGATTHIKFQGKCGSCWAFSAVGALESYFLIKGVGKFDLSQQQIVDCQHRYCYGCDGGQEGIAMQYAVSNGLVSQAKYPYVKVQQRCLHDSGPHKIPNVVRYTGRRAIQAAVRRGPVTAAIHAYDEGFQFYSRGVFDRCRAQIPNHAVVLVGFTDDYWIIRNSWDVTWGQQGHMRIKKNQNNNNACSIEDDAYGVGQ